MFLKIVKNNKRKYLFFLVFLFLLFGYAHNCYALDMLGDLGKNVVDGILGSIARMTVWVLGWVTSKVVAMIIGFAQYNSFVNNAQVKEGWIVVRDICNMFFILILLFIAFAVILRMESYSIKKSLPKLLIMAVLINFSRTICGIMIDFSQIIMLTFIGPITQGSGNFSSMLSMDDFLTAVASENYQSMNISQTATYYIIAVIFMMISCVVLLAILIAFVIRIVMLWIYIVLSPLAFLLSSFPGGQRYAGQYWGEFTKYLINGPVLAFFLWLSLYIMGNLDTSQIGSAFADAPVAILQGENFARFVMAIGMLVGGLTVSAQIGGIGSSWGSSMVSNIKNKGIGVAKRVSGYDAVADRTKAYFAMRKSARDEKIRADVAGFTDRVGSVKKKYISDPTAAIGKAVWGGFGARKSTRLSADIEQLGKRNSKIDSDIVAFKGKIKEHEDNRTANNRKIESGEKLLRTSAVNGAKASYDGVEYEYNNGYWSNSVDNNVVDDSNFKNRIRQSVSDARADNQTIESKISRVKEKGIDRRSAEKSANLQEIERKNTQKTKEEERQKFWDKVGKAGLFATGGAIGAILGGVPGALYGAGAAGFGIPSIADDAKAAGKKDLKYANTYQADQVNSNREGLKDKDADQVRKEMDDPNNSLFKRMAAALELIARKETNPQEVKIMKERLLGGFGDKVKANFESEVSKNIVGASNLFDFDSLPENRNKVKDKFASASLSLDNLDSSTLQRCGQEIALGMKNPTFKRQYDSLSDTKKDAVNDGLKAADSYQAREKLAKVLSIDEAFGDHDDEKKKYTRSLSIKDIQEILNDGSEKKRLSLRNNITINNTLDGKALADDVFERLNKKIPASKTIKAALGVE